MTPTEAVLIAVFALVLIFGFIYIMHEHKGNLKADVAAAKTDLTALLSTGLTDVKALLHVQHASAVAKIAALPPIPINGSVTTLFGGPDGRPGSGAELPPPFTVLDPTAAVSMTQVAVASVAYVNYLNSLAAAALAAWQSAFVQAAHALSLTGGALLWDPLANSGAGAMLPCGDGPQANLMQLANLGAKGLITGAPGQ
jgi:hypothetical protein